MLFGLCQEGEGKLCGQVSVLCVRGEVITGCVGKKRGERRKENEGFLLLVAFFFSFFFKANVSFQLFTIFHHQWSKKIKQKW